VTEKFAKRKITIKRKNSTNSSVKGKQEQKTKNNEQNDQTDKKDSTLNKSVNEFLFF
jgi:hypothetical protein